ncbi:MAG TPA: hypothetical protein VJL87_02280, partial [Bdellovibrionota bacterium]|nr:hypothetical protein [Bdellovibrionota bacterium]
IREEVIDQVWQMILSFSGYSFCKPHSASYALVSMKSAYLRAHYTSEFFAAVISNQGGFYSAFAYLSEAKRQGIRVLLPDVNESEIHYIGKDDWIRVGLMQVKGLSGEGGKKIIEEREARGVFKDFEDFLARLSLPPSELRLLVKGGCCDSIANNLSRPTMIWRIYERYGDGDELSLLSESSKNTPTPAEYDESIILKHEVETLDMLVSRHPLDLYMVTDRGHSGSALKVPGSKGTTSFNPSIDLPFAPGTSKTDNFVWGKDLRKYIDKHVTMVGFLITGKTVYTKHDEPMEFVSFEDTTAIYETTFFPEAYKKFCHILVPGAKGRSTPFLLRGKVEANFGVPTLSVTFVEPLNNL